MGGKTRWRPCSQGLDHVVALQIAIRGSARQDIVQQGTDAKDIQPIVQWRKSLGRHFRWLESVAPVIGKGAVVIRTLFLTSLIPLAQDRIIKVIQLGNAILGN